MQKIEIPNFEGFFNNLFVFLTQELSNDIVCIVDLKQLGIYKQYKVIEGEEEMLHLSIKLINKEIAQKHIKDNIKLLTDEKGKSRSEEETINILQQRVHLQIRERFQFVIEDKKSMRSFKDRK